MNYLRFACLAAAVVLLAGWEIYSWGMNGHRIVGEIAQRHLTPEAARAVSDILDGEGLAWVANWPDEIRSDRSWACSAPFHYVTVPEGRTYLESANTEDGDALLAIAHYVNVLKGSNSSSDDRAVALRFLVHLVGDLHQPLHVGRGCDRGANQVRVVWMGEEANLHSVWDSGLIESQDLSFSEWVYYLDRLSSGAEEAVSPLDWVIEAQDRFSDAYTCFTSSRGDRCPCLCGGCEDGTFQFGGCQVLENCALLVSGDIRLSYQYRTHNTPIVEERLRTAGLRLAGMLNWIFSDREPPESYLNFQRQLDEIPDWNQAIADCAGNP